MQELTGLKNRDFVRIEGMFRTYYGGDQAWFGSEKAKAAACGTVAAANFICYTEGRRRIKQEDFLKFMTELYRYVHPMSFLSRPLGIWPAARLIRGMNRFRKGKAPVRFRAYYPRISGNRVMEAVAGSLKEDKPALVLVGLSGSFKGMTIGYPDGTSACIRDASRHWMTVTGLCREEATGEIYLKVSSWGGTMFLSLERWRRGFWPQCILVAE